LLPSQRRQAFAGKIGGSRRVGEGRFAAVEDERKVSTVLHPEAVDPVARDDPSDENGPPGRKFEFDALRHNPSGDGHTVPVQTEERRCAVLSDNYLQPQARRIHVQDAGPSSRDQRRLLSTGLRQS
jgi:hypothetical protein